MAIFFVFTFPLWILTGTITGINAAESANNGELCYPDDSWLTPGKFARLPQGLLPGIPRDRVKGSGMRVTPAVTAGKTSHRE